jgi:hypothetical protein
MKRVLISIAGAAVLAAAGAPPAAAHMTPSVTLTSRADFIRRALPGARRYFERTVDIGRDDYARIRKDAGFAPDEASVRFYSGVGADDRPVGVVLFVQVNTMHGPIEVGLAMGPGDSVLSAGVIRATVETKPWVVAAERAGLLDRFRGMRFGDDPSRALDGVSRDSLGAMPYYFGTVIVEGVKHGLGLYHVLGREGAGKL